MTMLPRPDLSVLYTRMSTVARLGGFSEEQFGQHDGYPLIGLQRLRADGPLLYFSAGMHGDEPAGVEALLQILEEEPARLEVFSLLICPLLNPGGYVRGTREDAAGCDLNRDYRKFSTAASQSHRDWLSNQPFPNISVSLHEDWEAQGFYLYEISTSVQPEIGSTITAAVSEKYPLEQASRIDGHNTTAPGYIYHPPEADLPEDWPEAIWLVKRAPCLSLTFETPSSEKFDTRVAMHREAFAAAIEAIASDA